MSVRLFAVCSPGLEPFLAQELAQLNLLPPISSLEPGSRPDVRSSLSAGEETGGVEFAGDLDAIMLANLWLRTASRVLVRLGDFNALGFAELRKKAGRLDWAHYLAAGQPVALRVTCHKSRLYHSGAVAERVAGAIGDRLGYSPPMTDFDENTEGDLPQLVVVRLEHDHCTISLDTSGALLHRRGYRLATAKAPLRETLAAGMLLAAGWDRASPLLDPFCGSGTIPIEAAWLSRGLAPGRLRRFAFMGWPGFDQRTWKALLDTTPPEPSTPSPLILASDRDAGAVRMAQANAERAGVAAEIQFSCRAVSSVEPPTGPGWVVSNPPYGVRVSPTKDLRNLYAQLGNVLRLHCPGWHAAILSSDPRLLGQIGLKLNLDVSLVNGGINVKLARGIVP
ncbi:MAG TPA: class I SAM-dependent RNA methyltransferase [Anaerolineales bacterium]